MSGTNIESMIEIHEIILNTLLKEKEYKLKQLFKPPSGYKPIDYSGMPHGSGGEHSLDLVWEELRELEAKIIIEKNTIESLQEQLRDLKSKIENLTDIDYKVVSMRDYEGLKLWQIAEKLNMSKEHIGRVSARNPKN